MHTRLLSGVLGAFALVAGCAPTAVPVQAPVEARPASTGASAVPAALLQPLAPVGTPLTTLPVGRCVNLGNHLDAPTETTWGRALADDDFAIIAAAGFQTVRMTVRWDTRTAQTAPYAIQPAFLQRVMRMVTLARAAGLNVILNNHHYESLDEAPAAHKERLAAIWQQVGAAFQGLPREHVWFELHNEPSRNLTNANLLEILGPALAAVRATNPDRPVIIGGERWSGIDSLATLQLPDDPYIVPTIHYYEPFDFTHQGATWVGQNLPRGRAYGTAADAARLAADLAKFRAYQARTGKTPFVGEIGAYDIIPLAQRLVFTRTIREAFDGVGAPTCVWAYTNTFKTYDSATRAWLPGMLEALGTR